MAYYITNKYLYIINNSGLKKKSLCGFLQRRSKSGHLVVLIHLLNSSQKAGFCPHAYCFRVTRWLSQLKMTHLFISKEGEGRFWSCLSSSIRKSKAFSAITVGFCFCLHLIGQSGFTQLQLREAEKRINFSLVTFQPPIKTRVVLLRKGRFCN